MTKLFRKLLIIVTIFFASNVFAYNEIIEHADKFISTVAKIEIFEEKKSELKLDNTVLSYLLKETGKDLEAFIEPNSEIIKFFRIEYNIVVDPKETPRFITQYGFFKDLNFKVQQLLLKQKKINIVYDVNNPIKINFVINKKLIAPSTLITKLSNK